MSKLTSPARPPADVGRPAGTSEDGARLRLLQAAERVLIEEGAAAVSVRRLAAAAGCNSSLASYHFGGLDGLLEAVGNANLDAMIALRSRLLSDVSRRDGQHEQLRQVIEAYARPMWMPSCHAGLASAAFLLAQMMSLTRSEFRQSIVERVGASIDEACARARPRLPHLSERALRLRLRFLLGAIGYAEPGHWTADLFDRRVGGAAPSKQVQEQLMRFAEGALLAE